MGCANKCAFANFGMRSGCRYLPPRVFQDKEYVTIDSGRLDEKQNAKERGNAQAAQGKWEKGRIGGAAGDEDKHTK